MTTAVGDSKLKFVLTIKKYSVLYHKLTVY